MRNFNNNDKPDSGEKSGFRREDSSHSNNSNHTDSAMQFRKDKRSRTSRVEKVSRETKPSTYTKPDYSKDKPSGSEQPRRSSFNPNFTKDNKRVGSDSGDRSKYGSDRPKYNSDKPKFGSSDKPRYGSDKPSFGGDKPRYGSDKPSFGGDKPKWKPKPGGDWKPKSDRPDYKSGGKGSRTEYKPAGKKYDSTNYPKFAAPKQNAPIRLNRHLAMSGLCSRREADDYIAAGVVTVNGVVVTELGTKIEPTDVVKFNDSVVRGEKKVYIVMNKPKGFVTTIEDPHADKTVMDIVKSACSERVYPVGRLDKNSVGVLLITNDGDLTRQLTHPGYVKKKIYQVALDKPLTKADLEQIGAGIILEDGPIHADAISYVGESKKDVGIEIHSGRNRIIRRIFESLGYKVQKLDRVYFAGLTKKSLKRGAWRYLSPKEVSMLKSGEYE